MKRTEFLRTLGLSGAALMSVYCLGTLTSCSKKDNDPKPTTTTPSGKLDFTIDLSSNDFKKLKTEGEFLYKDDLLIAHAKGGSFIALAKKCTHQGTDVQFIGASNEVKCPNHGSRFKTDGSVLQGPAASALKVFKTEVVDNGAKLRVFEA